MVYPSIETDMVGGRRNNQPPLPPSPIKLKIKRNWSPKAKVYILVLKNGTRQKERFDQCKITGTSL